MKRVSESGYLQVLEGEETLDTNVTLAPRVKTNEPGTIDQRRKGGQCLETCQHQQRFESWRNAAQSDLKGVGGGAQHSIAQHFTDPARGPKSIAALDRGSALYA